MPPGKYTWTITFRPYERGIEGRLMRSIEAGKRDCLCCGARLTNRSAALVGRAWHRGKGRETVLCKSCEASAGGFEAACRIAAEEFQRRAFGKSGGIFALADIHPIAGHG